VQNYEKECRLQILDFRFFFRSYFLLFAISFSGKKSQKKDAAAIRARAFVLKKSFYGFP
jgi:hypothetical protein